MPTENHKGGLPKYLRTQSEGAINDGVFIVHTQVPRCVGMVVMEGTALRVYMRQAWDKMTPAEEQDMCIEMKKWFYYKYVQ